MINVEGRDLRRVNSGVGFIIVSLLQQWGLFRG